MKVRPATALLVMLATALCMPLHSSLSQDDSKAVFREAEKVKVHTKISMDDRIISIKFNFGRPFLVSLNSGIPESKTIRTELVGILNQKGILDQVVFDWFGPSKLESIHIMIGNRIPVALAQSILRVFSRQGDLPINLSILDTEGFSGSTQRVYVGGLVKNKFKPLTQERIEDLLKDGLEQSEFFRIAQDYSKDQ